MLGKMPKAKRQETMEKRRARNREAMRRRYQADPDRAQDEQRKCYGANTERILAAEPCAQGLSASSQSPAGLRRDDRLTACARSCS